MLGLESGHEELIHAAAWNVSSLTSGSPRGNKEVEFGEGEETHEKGTSWPAERRLVAKASSCLEPGSDIQVGFP